MILSARVIDVHDGSQFSDELERVTVRIQDADPMQRDIRIVNRDGLKLGQEFQLLTADVDRALWANRS